jgi:hypothetical protein
METIEIKNNAKPLHVLLIGNNPIDMGRTLEKVNQIRGRRIITEIAFDLKSILERLVRFSPNFILIDDNIGKSELTQTVNTLLNSRKTKNVPITVLKNSNYQESSGSTGVWDYMLKQNLTAESLYHALRNSLKFRRTQQFLYKAYQKRSKQIKKFAF